MPTDNNSEWCNDSSLYFQKKDASRVFTLHKKIVEDISISNAMEILDYGSGDGKILESFPSINRYKFTLHDPDESAMNEAIKKFNGYENVRFEADSNNLPSNFYDAVIFCNVIMCVKSTDNLQETIQTIKRIKRKTGAVYAGLTHPCFLDKQFATYSNDFSLGEKSFDYFDNGAIYHVYMQEQDNTIVIKDFFWNLSLIINLFLMSGFNLLSIKELRDVEKNNFSPFMILKFN